MIKRVFVLLILLVLRCVLGYVYTLRFDTDRQISIKGKVINIYLNDMECIMELKGFKINSGKICAATAGDRVRVIGTLERKVIDSFGGELWLVSKQIDILERTQVSKDSRTKKRELVDNFREDMVNIYKKFVPEPEAGLVAGIVLGYKKDIGQELYEQMIKSGSVHIAVASGYNILLVGGVIMSLSFWIMKRSGALLVAISGMIVYGLLAGGDPPVVRAIWMASFMYFGQLLGRGNISSWILLLTVWAMLMIDPTLIESVSFQLSVAASFGLMVVEPWLTKKLTLVGGREIPEILGKVGLTTTLSTTLVTMPILWWHFGRLTLIGILSNILILPFVPPLMLFGAGMIIFPWLFSWPAYALAHYLVLVIRFFGS